VSHGIEPRELRRAYLQLVRRYKPEHAPEEFRRIREAFEAIQNRAELFLTLPTGFGEIRQRGSHVPPAAVDDDPFDLWEHARRDEVELCYRQLLERRLRTPAVEAIYLQLYWLLFVDPELEPGRAPVDWLVRFLESNPGRRGPTRELLGQTIAENPSLSLEDPVGRLLGPEIDPDLVSEVAGLRWRAARRLGAWDVITSDIERLRGRSSGDLEAIWPRMLFHAGSQLVWAGTEGPALARALVHEVEKSGHPLEELADEFHRIDFAIDLATARESLRGQTGLASRLYDLIPVTWEESSEDLLEVLRPFLAEVAREPVAALRSFDGLIKSTPIVLGHLKGLLNRLEYEQAEETDPRTPSDLIDPIQRLLMTGLWRIYNSGRPALLERLIRESISPEILAQAVAGQPQFTIETGQHLAEALEADWPIRAVYKACDLAGSGSV
jgi:hypothetical protein